MAVQLVVGAVGAAIAAASQIAANLQKGADPIDERYPDPDPVEQQIAKIQLETARALREKIDDPRVLEVLYGQLPDTKMSPTDRAAFTEEYTQIKQTVAAVSAEQTNSAMGEKLDDLVERGVMSPEAAAQQKIKNEAAINAVVKIWNKKLDAARIGMARGQFFKDAKVGLGNASIIADVDSRNRQIYNGIINQVMGNMANRQSGQSQFENKVAWSNMGNKMFNADTINQFNQGIMQKMIPYGSGSSGGGGGMDMSSFMNMFGSGGGGGGPSGGGFHGGGFGR